MKWKGCSWLRFWKMLLCIRYRDDESRKRQGPYCVKVCFPVVTIPSLLGSDSYLVEVGGPVLSLLGLSFICELFVCSALHCHTAFANLPNESQELHNNEKMTAKQHLLLLIGQVYTNFQTNSLFFLFFLN